MVKAPDWEIRQSPEFSRKLDEYATEYGNDLLPKVERAILWALTNNPAAFPIVPGFQTIRYIRVSSHPGFRVLFRIDGRTVDLLYIERNPFADN